MFEAFTLRSQTVEEQEENLRTTAGELEETERKFFFKRFIYYFERDSNIETCKIFKYNYLLVFNSLTIHARRLLRLPFDIATSKSSS